MLFPLGALFDPSAQRGDLGVGQLLAALDRRHDLLRITVRNPGEHFLERRLGVCLAIQSQIPLARLGIGPVTLVAIGGEDRADMTVKGNGLGGAPGKRGDQGNQQ